MMPRARTAPPNTRALAAVAGALVVLALVATSALAASGDPDKFFSEDGVQTIRFGGAEPFDVAHATATLPDAKLVIVGSSAQPSGEGVEMNDMAIAQLTSDGKLDPSFSADGMLTLQFASGKSGSEELRDEANDVAVQDDGKLVIAGTAQPAPGQSSRFAVVRLNKDGSLDTGFSGDGKQTVAFPDTPKGGSALSVAVRDDGKIVLGGFARRSNNDADVALARLKPDGGLDTSFSGDGRKQIRFGNSYWSESASEVLPLASGKLITVGTLTDTYTDDCWFVIRRFEKNGTPDSGFASFGLRRNKVGSDCSRASAAAITNGGRIVAVGEAAGNYANTGDIAIARYTSSGDLDTTFSGNGKKITEFGSSSAADGVAIRSDGRIVAGGYSQISGQGGQFAVVAYKKNGKLDPTFSGDGLQTTAFPHGAVGSDLKITRTQRVLVVGDAFVPPVDNTSGLRIFGAAQFEL